MVMIDPIEVTPIDVMPLDPFMESTDIPKPDTPFTYTGEGVQPSWNNVYNAAEKDFDKQALPADASVNDSTGRFMLRIGHVAVGSALKATSGFINRVAQAGVDGDNAVLSIMNANLLEINRRFTLTGHALSQTIAANNFMARYVVPSLQTQITQNLAKSFAFALAAQGNAEQWTKQHVFAPLYAELLKVQPAIDTSIIKNNQAERARTSTEIEAKIAPVAALVATLAPAIRALQTESEQCTQPMCQTMGPKTDLGKFLKALATAATLADIAYLLSLNERELVQRITDTIAHFAGYVGTLESDFIVGGKSIGQVIAGL